MKIIGCYAQTELGHGSNVADLETTATLDEINNEWILHTPAITATKFWPGSMGLAANYAMVYAQCITKAGKFGVRPFLAPIRDLDTHMPLPGVKVGDLGQKLGWNGVDNGWLQFNHHRIPAKNMMGRFAFINDKLELETRGD